MDDAEKLEGLTERAGQVVREVAVGIAFAYGKVNVTEIEIKSLNSLVSHVDREAEKALVTGLSAILPGCTFLTEEETVIQGSSGDRWIIDPLDGTTNFLHGLPFFAISIALERDSELILGIVHEVSRSEHFSAWKGGGAWLNGHRIVVSDRPDLESSLIATGFPYYDFELMDVYMKVLKGFMYKTRGVRRLGSAALDMAYVACGRFDAYYEYALHPWDVAGGIVLVREAGGLVTDFSGSPDCHSGKEILAASSKIHSRAQSEIKLYF